MKILILEDDIVCQIVLQKLLAVHGECHVAVQGREAVAAFNSALTAGQPYNLVCLDIMVPELDGHGALREIRKIEKEHGIFSGHGTKIIMTTGLEDMKNVMASYAELCHGYLPKPITQESLTKALEDLNLAHPLWAVF